MQKHLRNEAGKEVLVETPGEAEAGPVVSVFQDLQSVTLEVNLSIEVLLVEDLHGNLALATVLGPVMLVVEVQVVLDRAARVLGLLILAGRDGGRDGPEDHQNRDGGEDGKEDGGVEAAAHLASKVPRDANQESNQQCVREAVITCRIRRERGIFDRRILSSNASVYCRSLPVWPRSPVTTYRGSPHTALLRGSSGRRSGGSLDELKVLGGLRVCSRHCLTAN